MSTVQSPASSRAYSDQLSLRSDEEDSSINLAPLSNSPSFNLNNLNLNNLNNLNLNSSYLRPSDSSTNASIASSDIDYQNDCLNISAYPSRPLSRSSNTSGMSITATKDGIEGKRLHRHNNSNYSYLLTNMFGNSYSNTYLNNSPNNYSTNYYNSPSNADDDEEDTISTVSSTQSISSHPPNIPSAPPITLKEKIQLLKTGSVPQKPQQFPNPSNNQFVYSFPQGPLVTDSLDNSPNNSFIPGSVNDQGASIGPVVVMDKNNDLHESDPISDYANFQAHSKDT